MSAHAYVADPADVDALVTNLLGDVLAEQDPAIRYAALSQQGVLFAALVERIADHKARCASDLARPVGTLSLSEVATALSLGTKVRAQQLVERGRRLDAPDA